MRRKSNAVCNCGHYQCDHIEEKIVKLTGRKTRMGCSCDGCKCEKFLDEKSVAGMKSIY